MAKMYGLGGVLSGKMGNVVLAVTNGIQVARQYQPIVANPKSGLQLMQRSKGNLAGRISSFVPRTAIMGLGDNNRQRRGEFLRNILKKATATMIGSDYSAKIADEDVLFSRGSVIMPAYANSITAEQTRVNISLTALPSTVIPADEYSSYVIRVVGLVYSSSDSRLIECVTKIATMPAQASTATTTLPITSTGGYDVVVYAIPMRTTDGSAVAISSEMVNRSDSELAALLSVNEGAVVFAYGRSVVAIQGTYTPA